MRDKGRRIRDISDIDSRNGLGRTEQLVELAVRETPETSAAGQEGGGGRATPHDMCGVVRLLNAAEHK